ncbi:MAG: hypothetical protein SV186_03735 [Candidatus Nanohaloarchaea archaeon]|nr:hypothetical protein [Candidatus Nanohaloarchaea archaeon]
MAGLAPTLVLFLIAGGLVAAYAGYWVHHFFLEIVGFVVGAAVVGALVYFGVIKISATSTLVMTILFIVMSGIVGSFIATKMERLFVSFLGSIAGSTLAGMVLSAQSSFFSPKLTIISMFSAVVTWKMFKYAVKFITAILGAYMASLGLTMYMNPDVTISTANLFQIWPTPFYAIAITGAAIQTGLLQPLKWVDLITAEPESSEEPEEDEDDRHGRHH